MALQDCNCDTGLFNLQSADCIKTPDIARKFIFVKYFLTDGTVNGLDLTGTIDETTIDALLAQSDKNLRWFLTDRFHLYLTDRADPNFETIDNENFFLSQGTRTTSADFLTADTDLANRLDGSRCVDLGMFIVDTVNGLSGVVTRDLFLDPIRLNKETVWSKVIFATEGARHKVHLAFEWDRLVSDGDVRTLSFADHGTDLINKRGLIDVLARFGSAPLSTTVEIDFYTVEGSASGSAFTGLVFGDFILFNETTQLPVVVTGSVEAPDGTYVLTFVAQTTNDVLTVTATQTGFDFSQTTDVEIIAL